jgi:hypothetical protein
LRSAREIGRHLSVIVLLAILASLTTVEMRIARRALPAAVPEPIRRYEYSGPPLLFRPPPPPPRRPTVHPLDADADPFDYIALCESGANADLDTGNGFYGAFQFALPTWRSLGMSGKPNEFTYEEQKAAAQRLQKRSGWGQWPSCARKYGLLRE